MKHKHKQKSAAALQRQFERDQERKDDLAVIAMMMATWRSIDMPRTAALACAFEDQSGRRQNVVLWWRDVQRFMLAMQRQFRP